MSDNEPVYVLNFLATMWLHSGSSSWYFVSLPESESNDIDDQFGSIAKGFGSQRVEVTVGSSTWRTSIFPDKKRGSFLLPIKKAIRTKEKLSLDEPFEIEFRILIAE